MGGNQSTLQDITTNVVSEAYNNFTQESSQNTTATTTLANNITVFVGTGASCGSLTVAETIDSFTTLSAQFVQQTSSNDANSFGNSVQNALQSNQQLKQGFLPAAIANQQTTQIINTNIKDIISNNLNSTNLQTCGGSIFATDNENVTILGNIVGSCNITEAATTQTNVNCISQAIASGVNNNQVVNSVASTAAAVNSASQAGISQLISAVLDSLLLPILLIAGGLLLFFILIFVGSKASGSKPVPPEGQESPQEFESTGVPEGEPAQPQSWASRASQSIGNFGNSVSQGFSNLGTRASQAFSNIPNPFYRSKDGGNPEFSNVPETKSGMSGGVKFIIIFIALVGLAAAIYGGYVYSERQRKKKNLETIDQQLANDKPQLINKVQNSIQQCNPNPDTTALSTQDLCTCIQNIVNSYEISGNTVTLTNVENQFSLNVLYPYAQTCISKNLVTFPEGFNKVSSTSNQSSSGSSSS